MAHGSTLYRVKMDLSDVDRGVYESLAFRIACHPSESEERLVTRIIAYGLLYESNLEFTRGLSEGSEPALWSHDLTGQLLHRVDVGAPSAERIHAASKKAEQVSIVCHRGSEALEREMQKRTVHGAENIQVLMLDPKLVESLAEAVERAMDWTLVRTDDALSISIGDHQVTGRVERVALPQ